RDGRDRLSVGRPPHPMKPSRWSRWLPGVVVLRAYRRDWLRGDLLAGVTVAAYLVPQVMAYAEVAGLPAAAGLSAVVGPLLVYAVLGTSRQLSVGPESSTALMTAAAVGVLVGPSSRSYADVAAALAIAVGLVCVVGWVARLGFLASLLSRPVLVGYMAGIAVLMVVGQLGKVTGVPVPRGTTLSELGAWVEGLGHIHGPTVGLAAVTLTLLLVSRRLWPRSPGPLVAMLLGVAAVKLGLGELGVQVVGPVGRVFAQPDVPDLSAVHVATLLPAALGVAVVAYSDNIATARAFAARRREEVDSGQEFLALGVANVTAGLLHGFPVSSSGSRTAIGDAMGSRTQLHSLVALATVVVATTLFAPVLALFPTAALGAVVVYAATRLVDVGELRRFARFRRSELVLALATTLAVLGLDVLYGIAVAVGLSILDVLRRIAHPHDGVLGYVPGLAGMHDVDDFAVTRQVPGLCVYRYDAPLFFANAEDFRRRALAAVEAAGDDLFWLVLNAEGLVEVDLTGLDALLELEATLRQRGVTLALTRVKHELRQDLEAGGVVARIGPELIFPTLPTAVAAYIAAYTARYGAAPPGLVVPPLPAQPAPPEAVG
ncbi:MAG: Sulfate permease, partial [Friedmanniella sp.]|nr:Sulfate permease [Friedmanniella sp.]